MATTKARYQDMTGAELYRYCGSDARRWAEAFIQCTGIDLDLSTTTGWFANAMMGQYDAAAAFNGGDHD